MYEFAEYFKAKYFLSYSLSKFSFPESDIIVKTNLFLTIGNSSNDLTKRLIV